MNPPHAPEALARDARARVIWGDPPETVIRWLADHGVPEAEARDIVRGARMERGREIRLMGLRDAGIGLLLLALGVAIALYIWNGGGRMSPRRSETFAGGCIAAAIGFWRTLRGIERILEGAAAQGSIPDME